MDFYSPRNPFLSDAVKFIQNFAEKSAQLAKFFQTEWKLSKIELQHRVKS
ncbi:hypothetical protein [Okeania sp. SIO1I7]|nr:hypothetical protein [Okeania sp. SIO1I7]NET29943.1 hypothetical protein [Okeania sp. SIO1I7]